MAGDLFEQFRPFYGSINGVMMTIQPNFVKTKLFSTKISVRNGPKRSPANLTTPGVKMKNHFRTIIFMFSRGVHMYYIYLSRYPL